MTVSAQMGDFHARMVAPGRVLVRANTELFLADLAAGQKAMDCRVAGGREGIRFRQRLGRPDHR